QTVVNVYASGIHRTLLPVKPRREQAYETMELMQFNWFHDKGVFEIEPVNNNVVIHYDRFPAAISEMLETVLKIQYEGDRAAADAFIDRWTSWNDQVHETIAKTIRENRGYQYALFKYGVLGE